MRLSYRISLRREGAVSKEVLNDISASGKKLSKAEKDERCTHLHTHSHTHTPCLVHFRVSWKKNEVADTEATTFAIFYNNTLYLFLVLFLLYFMRSFNPALYPLHTPSFSLPLPHLSLSPSATVYLHVPSTLALPSLAVSPNYVYTAVHPHMFYSLDNHPH